LSPTLSATRPTSVEDCAAALAEANAKGRTVRIRGGGTKDYLGDLVATDTLIETTALAGIVAHVPADLTVTVRAGTRLADVRAALANAGQMLPLDPPHDGAATIGGIVAANSTGFRRARYGGVRDLLIGTTYVLADGSVAHAGGRVVKNVAGYDLNKVLTGSLGTLALIVECTFKVLPLPAATAALRARFTSAADAFALCDAVARTSARPAALALEGRGPREWSVVVEAAGDPAAVERTLKIASDAADHAKIERVDDPETALTPLRDIVNESAGALVRASLPPAAQLAFADTALRLNGFTRLVADAASGVVRVHVRADDDDVIAAADALLAAARAVGGAARVERRAERLRAQIPAWGDGDLPGLFLMRRRRSEFDPKGILEPGRGPVR
jgi:glycolate oxidase FAD binding subunit